MAQLPNRRRFLRSVAAVGFGGMVAGCTSEKSKETTTTRTTETEVDLPPETTESQPSDAFEDLETNEPKDLTHLYGISGQTYPDQSVSGNYKRRFEWESELGEWWMEMEFPRSLGRYYKQLFGRSGNYDRYVTDAYGDGYISNLADEFERIGEEYDLSKREIVDLTIDFVQNLQYTEDEVTAGYDQYTSYPVETLIDRGGDCEDSAILLAALLRELEYGVLLLGLFDAEPAHMALGVKGDNSVPGTYYEYEGNRYYYVEPTGENWDVGEMPDMSGSTSAEMIEINPHPTLVYEYQTKAPESDRGIAVNVTVGNVGGVASLDTSMELGFVDKTDHLHGYEELYFGSLKADEERTKEVTLHPSENVPLKFNTRLYEQNDIYDIHESDWRYS